MQMISRVSAPSFGKLEETKA